MLDLSIWFYFSYKFCSFCSGFLFYFYGNIGVFEFFVGRYNNFREGVDVCWDNGNIDKFVISN